MVGRTLGHYRVLDKLGEGGMGEVYLAEDTRLERKVALKVLPAEMAESPERLARFEREAKAVAALNHPNIVHVYSVEKVDGVHFFTMEFVEGESLGALIPAEGLPLEQFFDLAIPLAGALFEAHEHGIIHRDLKPANVMVDRQGQPKILDFGLAKLVSTEAVPVATEAPTEIMTQPGMVFGTFPYLSPEQAVGEAVDHRADIFSFGIVLYEMVAGQRPFRGDSPVSLINSILNDEAPPLFEVRSAAPEALDWTLARCLEKQPDQRYSSAAELQERLEELRNAMDSGVELPAPGEVQFPAFLSKEIIVEPDSAAFVGRDAQLVQLEDFLSKACDGQGQVVFITGEAGTGKTALAQAFVRRAQDRLADVVATVGGCSAHTGPGDPYGPIRQVLAQLTGDVESLLRTGALSQDRARRLWELIPAAASSLVESASDLVETLVAGEGLLRRAEAAAQRRAAWLHSLKKLVDRKLALPPDVMLQQGAVFGQCTRLLQELAVESPLLLVFEDLHWSDTGSVDLLSHLARHLAGHRILIVGTYRPSEIVVARNDERHPLEAVVHEVTRSFGDSEVHLSQEAELAFVSELIDTEPNRLGAEFRQALFRQTQGHPLFTVELLRTMQERGMLVQDEDGSWVEHSDLDWGGLPAQVDGVISERIGRLSGDLRELLKVASVEGEDFTAEVLSRIQKTDTRETVRLLSQELERHHRLVIAEGLKRVNSNRLSLYRFLHVLFQKYLYDELDEAERAYLHEDVGNALEELFGERSEEIAAQLARHFEEAGVIEKAIPYWALAGQRAVRVTANLEAIGHYQKAIGLLRTLPPSLERDGAELDLQTAVCGPLTMTQGWSGAGVGAATSRALELADNLGESPKILPALWFLSSYYGATGEMPRAVEKSDRELQVARELGDETQIAIAHWTAGIYRGFSGMLVDAREHLVQAEAGYLPEAHAGLAFLYGLDFGVAAKIHLSWVLAYLGFLEQSRVKADEALALAQSLGHPHTLCFAIGVAAVSDWRRKDWESMRSHATESLEMATEHGFPHAACMELGLKGLAIANLGDPEEGIPLVQAGIALEEQIGTLLNRAMLFEMLGSAHALNHDVQAAQEAFDSGIQVAEDTGELKFREILPTRKGAVYAASEKHDLAEKWLLEGIERARGREMKLFELEASTALAGLWRQLGKNREARDLLSPVYDWFTEGFDEVPLKEARAVLEELS